MGWGLGQDRAHQDVTIKYKLSCRMIIKKHILPVPAVVDVEVGSHNRSGEKSGVSPCYSINHGSYRPPMDMSGNTQCLLDVSA